MSQPLSDSLFNTSDRINQLNAIDKDIVELLQAAGSVMTALVPPQENDESPKTFEERQKAVLDPSKQYLATLDSTRTRVRRQIMALEEARVISAEAPVRSGIAATQPGGATTQQDKDRAADLGTGRLDVGWLNARDDRVEKGMERELWQKAKTFMDAHEQTETHKQGADAMNTS